MSLTVDLAADELLVASIRVLDILAVANFVSFGVAAVDAALAGGAGLRHTADSWPFGPWRWGGGRQGGARDEDEADERELHVDWFVWDDLDGVNGWYGMD